ncbi:MAG: hypothetical protein IKF90_19450 [Parasporobacterium sp.]|nr:hypothetical protein [Parasporobacterium sp.]
MKEYRIVATVEVELGDGRKRIVENAHPQTKGGPIIHSYRTKKDAKKALDHLRKVCKEFDAMTYERFAINPRDNAKYTQTNIRIQSREVTDWKDE